MFDDHDTNIRSGQWEQSWCRLSWRREGWQGCQRQSFGAQLGRLAPIFIIIDHLDDCSIGWRAAWFSAASAGWCWHGWRGW